MVVVEPGMPGAVVMLQNSASILAGAAVACIAAGAAAVIASTAAGAAVASIAAGLETGSGVVC